MSEMDQVVAMLIKRMTEGPSYPTSNDSAWRDGISDAIEIIQNRGAMSVTPRLARISEIVREFKAEGGYEFVAQTAPEAFLQQEIKQLLSDLQGEING
jgi:hypothetical protein